MEVFGMVSSTYSSRELFRTRLAWINLFLLFTLFSDGTSRQVRTDIHITVGEMKGVTGRETDFICWYLERVWEASIRPDLRVVLWNNTPTKSVLHTLWRRRRHSSQLVLLGLLLDATRHQLESSLYIYKLPHLIKDLPPPTCSADSKFPPS